MKLSGKITGILTKIFDMAALSLFFLLCCIPVVTVIPAACALYQTGSKVLRHDVGKVTGEFFKTFKDSLRQGIPLSLIYILLAGILFGMKLFYDWKGVNTNLGSIYFVFVLVFSVVLACVSYYLIPVITRFSVTLGGGLRLALWFGAKNLFTMIPLVITFAGAVALCYVVPFALIIVPGFYAWLWALPVEKSFKKYITEELKDPEAHEGMWYMD